MTERNAGEPAHGLVAKYARIAPFYDFLDLPFERARYRQLRPLLFEGLSGRLLDAGVGTGRNIPTYPAAAEVTGIDTSPAMLERAERRRSTRGASVTLRRMDVTDLAFPDASFDAAVASFLFCVLPEPFQEPALRELARVVRPGGTIRLLEYVRPSGTRRRIVASLWEPWMAWAYGAGFDRHTEGHIPADRLAVTEVRYVVDDLVKLISLRVLPRPPEPGLPPL